MNTLEYTAPAAWDRIAPGYDKTNTSTQMWLGTQGLRRVGCDRSRPGQGYIHPESGEDPSPLLEPGQRGLRTLDLTESDERFDVQRLTSVR